MTRTDTDSRIEAALGGSQEAFGALIASQYRTIYAIALSRVSRWDAAEDLTQDTFLVAWQHRDSLRDPVKFPAWLMQIARNLSRNWLRSAAYRRQLLERAERNGTVPAGGLPQDEAVDMNERVEAVDEAIEALPETLREAVVLYYLHEKSVEETARVLGISVSAVKKRTQRGREMMRAHMDNTWEERFSSRAQAMPVQERAARLAGLLALAPASSTLGKAAAVEAAASVMAAGTGVTSAVGVKVAAVAVVVLGLAAGIGIPLLRPDAKPVPARTLADTIASTAGTGNDVEAIADDAPAEPVVEPATEGPSESAASPVDVAAAVVPSIDPPAWFSLAGTVVDETGAPIRGARVYVAPRFFPNPNPDAFQPVVTTASGSGGHFSLENIPEGAYQIGATMAGYADSRARTITFDSKMSPEATSAGVATLPGNGGTDETKYETVGQSVDDLVLTLGPLEGEELYAQILDQDGQPMADAAVVCQGFAGTDGSMRSGSSGGIGAVTDSRGHVAVEVPGLGMATLMVTGSDGAIALIRDVPVDPANPVSLRWPEPAALEGVVDGEGRDDARVVLKSVLRVEQRDAEGRVMGAGVSGGPQLAAAIGPDGHYRLDNISVELEYSLVIRDSENAPLSPETPLPPFEPGKTAVFNYTIRPATQIAGTVRGAVSGMPLRDIQVMWRSLDDPQLREVKNIGPDGTYVFDVRLPAGNYIVVPQYFTRSLPESETTYGKTFVLEPGTNVSLDLQFEDPVSRTIHVVDEAGEPVAGADISYSVGSSGWGWGLMTDEDGFATYAAVVPGEEAKFRVQAQGYERGQTAAFAGDPGDVFDPETVVLRKK